MHRLLIAAAIAATLAACNEAPKDTAVPPKDVASAAAVVDNPFFAPSALPLQAPAFDKIDESHYLPAFEAGMREQRAEMAAIAALAEPPTFDNTIVAMERSGATLFRVSKVFFNLTESTTNDQIGEIQAKVAPLLAQHSDAIYLDAALYARVKSLFERRTELGLDAESQRLVERYRQNFVRAGAELSEADKAKVRAINEELSSLQTRFSDLLLKDANASALVLDAESDLDGLSSGDIAAAKEAAKERGLPDKWVLALQLPTGQPALAQLKNRAVRERLYRASIDRGNRGGDTDTNALLTRIASLRADKASLLGFANSAAYGLDAQMAKTPEAVLQMLTGMVPAAMKNADAEAAKMQALIDREGGGFQLAPWDWAYYAEKVRQAEYDLDDAAVRPYFELDRVLNDGVFYAANRLFGVTVKERKDLPVYHPDVRTFDVLDRNGEVIGLFYADYFARTSKRGGAWMDSFVDQSGLLGTKPVVVNVLNVPKPPAGEPVLLSFDDTNTLFHEFGHALHGLLSNVRYPLLSGTNVPRDYVEFPSQWNENWTLHPEVLKNYAKHYQTGEPIPAELVEKIDRASTFNQGFATVEYLSASLLDMAWHLLPAGQSVSDAQAFEREALDRYGVAHPAVPPRYRSTYFMHIWPGGYGAGYYSYLWSEVLDADAYQWFEQNGGLTAENGERFQRLILSRGDTAPQMQHYLEFAGREPAVDALLQRRGLQ
jgi:peptidyl-dipeptidase Dcp